MINVLRPTAAASTIRFGFNFANLAVNIVIRCNRNRKSSAKSNLRLRCVPGTDEHKLIAEIERNKEGYHSSQKLASMTQQGKRVLPYSWEFNLPIANDLLNAKTLTLQQQFPCLARSISLQRLTVIKDISA